MVKFSTAPLSVSVPALTVILSLPTPVELVRSKFSVSVPASVSPFDAVKVPAEPNAAPGARLAPLFTVTDPAMLPLPPRVAPLLTDTAEASERIGDTTKLPFTNIAPVLTVVAPLCWPLPVSVQVPLPTFVMLVAALVVVLPPSVMLPAKVVFVPSAPML